MPDIAFNFAEDDKTLNVTLKGEGLLFSMINAPLLQQLLDENFPGLYVDEAELNHVVDSFNEQYKEAAEPDKVVVESAIAERRDATVTIQVSDDKMSAIARLEAAYGGDSLSVRDIALAALEAGVKKGLKKETIVRLVKQAELAPPGKVFEVEIARGKMAINGRDTKFKQLARSAKDRILRPKKRADGTVDMRDLGAIISVKKGEPLMQRIPYTMGQNGYTVTGEELEAKPGEDFQLHVGEGTRLSDKDPNLLIADRVGVPKLVERGMVVDEVYQTARVDVKTGHVEFEGAVIVTGDVCDGMKIQASGDVTVMGFVDSATIISGGDVIVKQGIIGRQIDNGDEAMSHDQELSCKVQAKGEIHSKYAQYAHLVCGGKLQLTVQALHCLTRAPEVWVGRDDKADGKVIGGHYTLLRHLTTGVLGAPAGSPLLIQFPQATAEIDEKIHKVNEQLEQLSAQLPAAKKAVDEVKKLPKSAERAQKLEQAVSHYQKVYNRFGQLNVQKENLQKERTALMESLYVRAFERVYAGVRVEIGNDAYRTTREHGPSTIQFYERKVHVDPLMSQAQAN